MQLHSSSTMATSSCIPDHRNTRLSNAKELQASEYLLQVLFFPPFIVSMLEDQPPPTKVCVPPVYCCTCTACFVSPSCPIPSPGAFSTAQAARHLKKVEPTRKQKDSTDTQASAYSYSAGNDPGGWGDAFTWYNAEASASSGYNGVYYNDGECAVTAAAAAE